MSEWLALGLLLLGAILANLLSSLSGGGAGLVQFPLLLLLGLPFSTALATHKVASVALGIGATLKHYRAGTIDWPITLYVTVAGTLGVIIGAKVILFVPSEIATRALGALIFSLGCYSLLKKDLGMTPAPKHRNPFGLIMGGLGLASIGILNGSLTAGTGLFVTLFLIHWFGFAYQQAVAITLVSVGLCWNGIGGLTLVYLNAPIYWPWLAILLLGSFIGGYAGAHLATTHSNKLIKRCFVTLTLFIGAKLLLGL
ncbi:putative membrane transporter protein YfcA [Vibrio stylophorae]|uniref:Probable membrane transporter protein n=1 Tax=Vibrio stylophorae TaxID=659351 RepID=A0ABN8DYY3_9VIBR|nr:sulfite exporter TauE/SafE family protein [Vibrio stylophorae]CAH0533999.1 putative membrane transporter protein YfcA [Vibrio stylophorae]